MAAVHAHGEVLYSEGSQENSIQSYCLIKTRWSYVVTAAHNHSHECVSTCMPVRVCLRWSVVSKRLPEMKYATTKKLFAYVCECVRLYAICVRVCVRQHIPCCWPLCGTSRISWW